MSPAPQTTAAFAWPEVEGEAFCRRWRIAEISVFGSAARGEEREDSDVDLLVRFHPDADWSLLDHVRMEDELAELLGRKVDLLTRRSVEGSHNPVLRDEILESARPLYAA